MAHSVSMDTYPCMDDVMEGFLDNVDLNQLDAVELGDFNDTLLENPMEYVDGISDSDSGISVAAEKNASIDQRDSENCVQEHNPFPISSLSDCVLTDAVGPITQSSQSTNAVSLRTESADHDLSRTSPKPGMKFKNPVRIIRLACSTGERNTIQVTKSQPVSVRKVLPIHSTNGVTGSSSAGTVSKPLLNGVIKLYPQNNSTNVQLHEPKVNNIECKIFEDSQNITSNSSISPDAVETGTFLDDYDPMVYSDTSLEQHLIRNTNGDMLHNFQTNLRPSQAFDQSSLSSSSPSYLGSCDTFGTSDCILTRAHLERIRKKQERMIKNRHAASMSRLRKKEYLERLEMRYEQLKRENHHLWRQNEEWRVRCLQLEQALNNLQSQVTDCAKNVGLEPHAQWNGTDQPEPCFSSSKTETPLKSSPPALKYERLSPGQSIETFSVRTDSIGYPSTTTSNSSTILRSTPRTSLCALYSKNPPSSNSAKFLTDSASLSQPNGVPSIRKTVLNNVIYPGKTGVNGSIHQQPTTRSNLVNLGGIISRHRAINFPTSRSKLIATTSLLTMVCLFSLNLLILPLNPVGFVGTESGNELARAPAAVGRWDSPRAHFGNRILLNIQSTEDDRQWNPTDGNPTKCKSSGLDSDCGEEPSVTFDANQTRFDEPVELLLGWIEEHTLSKVGLPFQNRGKKQSKHSYGPEAPKSRVPYSNIQPISNIGPSNGSQRINVIDVKLPDRTSSSGTHSGSSTNGDNNADTYSPSNLPSASSPLISDIWPPLSPIQTHQPLMTRPSSTAVNERGIQPFHRRLWDPDELITAAGRQNGTVYVILTHLDNVQLHPVNPTDRNATRKITLIVPAHPLETATYSSHKPLGIDARFSMLQVDCELVNVSLIQPLQTTTSTSAEGT